MDKFKTRRYQFRASALIALLRRFGPYLRPHRKTLLIAGICTFSVIMIELARPWPLKIIFDGLLMPQDQPDAVTSFMVDKLGDSDLLLATTALSILVLAILGGIFGFGQSFLIASVGQKVVAEIRLRLYAHIQRLSHSFHDERRTGDLLARLTEDVRMMRELMVSAAIFFTARVLVITATIAIMAVMDWRLTLVAVSILPALALVTARFGGEIKGATRRQRKKESQITEVMTESISAISVVHAYARQAYEEARFAKQNSSSARAGLRATRLEANMDRIVQVILACGTCAVIWYGVVRVRAGALSPGDLLVFTAYLASLYKPVRRIASLTGRISKATVCGERILAILDLQPDIKDLPHAMKASRFNGAIRFSDVTFGYSRGDEVLKNVSFEIPAGSTVALVGESGAGKSTIGSLLLRFYDPQSGAVFIDDCDIRDYTVDSLRANISVVLQDNGLFATTIRDNIAYGRLDASDDDIINAARLSCAHEFIEKLPDGYDTVVGERGATLSGGQRQRIAIARAIVRDTPVVILDEPMTGIDPANEALVYQALRKLMEGRTCIFITHDIGKLEGVDYVLQVDGTQVEAVAETWNNAAVGTASL